MSLDIVIWRQHFEDYADDAAFLLDWVPSQTGSATATWELSGTHTVDGTGVAAHLNLAGAVSEGDIYAVTKTLTPAEAASLQASHSYGFKRQAWASVQIAGLPAEQFNQLSTTVTTDASGNVDLVLRVTIVSGGTIDWDVWFDDVHLTQACSAFVVADLLRDVGVVQVGGSSIGYTRGGVEIEETSEKEALDFPGRKADVTEADLKRTSGCRLSFDMVTVVSNLTRAYPGLTSSSGTGLVNTLYTPHPAGTVLSDGDYLTDLTCVWPYHCGGFIRWRFTRAVAVTATVVARDKSEAVIRFVTEARADRTAYLADSQTPPWVIEVLDVVS